MLRVCFVIRLQITRWYQVFFFIQTIRTTINPLQMTGFIHHLFFIPFHFFLSPFNFKYCSAIVLQGAKKTQKKIIRVLLFNNANLFVKYDAKQAKLRVFSSCKEKNNNNDEIRHSISIYMSQQLFEHLGDPPKLKSHKSNFILQYL